MTVQRGEWVYMLSHSVMSGSLVALQAPLSMKFPRQEYWSWLPFPTPGYLSNPGIEPTWLVSPVGRRILYHWYHMESLRYTNGSAVQ